MLLLILFKKLEKYKMANDFLTTFWVLGMVMFLLSLQTGLIDMEMPHRLGAMSVILFIVAASLFQVRIEEFPFMPTFSHVLTFFNTFSCS